MQRYFIELAYKGTNFHGWQVQPNAVTVQELLNKAMSLLTREEINVIGCGRTDTGVHASFFVAHFDSKNINLESDDKFIYKINGVLPLDISVNRIFKVKNDASSRFDAKKRSYKYFISTKKDPFNNDYNTHIYGYLDIDKMNVCAKLLLEYTDFTSFSKLHTDAYTNNCKITEASWEKDGSKLVFSISADRFLRNMVRAIVGTLIGVGKGDVSESEFRAIIESKNRCNAGYSVPAKGLFLTNVMY